MLINVLGDVGSGKTLLLTWYALKFYKWYKIISNYFLKLRNFNELRLSEVFELDPNTHYLYLLDEAYGLIDSRLHRNDSNLYLSYFLNQRRKRNVTIIMSEQDFSEIDKRFRVQRDIHVDCKAVKDETFKYTYSYRSNNYTKVKYITPKIFNIVKKYYFTKQTVEPASFNELKWKILLKEPDRFILKVKSLVDKMIEYVDTDKRLTKEYMNTLLLKVGETRLPKEAYTHVYSEFRNRF